MKKIAIFASGSGTNAENIIKYFRAHPFIRVSLVVCNKPGAGVLTVASNYDVPVLLIEKERFFRGDHYLPELKNSGIDLIVLAGFLWKIPGGLVESYRGKIVNIHPALLPLHGGKGMYGLLVHQSVIDHQEKESGITIHYVDEHYDNGDIIFQARCMVEETDDAASLAAKIHSLEYENYPRIIEQLLSAKTVKM
jgi:phosphoribosylglycinamide formyltransferase 1